MLKNLKFGVVSECCGVQLCIYTSSTLFLPCHCCACVSWLYVFTFLLYSTNYFVSVMFLNDFDVVGVVSWDMGLESEAEWVRVLFIGQFTFGFILCIFGFALTFSESRWNRS